MNNLLKGLLAVVGIGGIYYYATSKKKDDDSKEEDKNKQKVLKLQDFPTFAEYSGNVRFKRGKKIDTIVTSDGKEIESWDMPVFENKEQIEVKIKQLHFWGFKTLCSIKRNAHAVDVKNIESKLSLIENATLINHRKYHAEIASLFFNIKGRSMHANMHAKHLTVHTKTKTPSIKNILPIH